MQSETETKEAQREAAEMSRAKRMRKASKGHWWLAVKGNGAQGREATLQVTLTHGLWLDLESSLVRAYLRDCEARARTRATREVEPANVLGFGLFLDNASVERTMALYEAGVATWGHVGEGPAITPARLAHLGEQAEAKEYEAYKADLLRRSKEVAK